MMKFKRIGPRIGVLGVAVLLHSSATAGVYSGPTTTAAFNSLLSLVQSNSIALSNKVAEATLAGVNTDYAQVSQVTINLFKNTFAPWDRTNQAAVQAMYTAIWYMGQKDPVGVVGLPFDELADCNEVASNAIAELQLQIDGVIELQAPPNFAAGTVVLNGKNYEHNGKRVIPSKFFWQPFDEDIMQAYGRMGEGYLAITDMDANNNVINWKKSDLQILMNSQTAAKRVPQQFFLGHTVGSGGWQRTAVPDAFNVGSRLFTHYDIDHPIVPTWLNALFAQQLAPAVSASGSGTPRIHMLANEPVWSIRQGGVDANKSVSSHTFGKFSTWLQSKYGSIAILNATYGTGYGSFSQAAAANYATNSGVSAGLQGGPIWYDWCRFNMDRVNAWFTYLKNGMQSVDPNGPTHLKIMGERAIHTDYHDEGIDFEFVTKLVEIPGSDNQCTSLRAEYDVRFEQDWRNRDVLEWRSQAIMLDFMKSIAPNKPFFDSEWHGLSGSRWRDFHMEPKYVRAVFWLAAVDGLGAMNAWVWNRLHPSGAIDTRADFIGTTVTQPLQLDAFGRTMKELNAHGDDVTSLVPEQRYYVIYYCKDSAIQDVNYSDDMADVYEALKLQNIPVGFTTPTELSSVSNTTQTLIVPRTKFISNTDLAGLQSFASGGGTIVVVQPSETFTKTELGGNRGGGGGFTPYATVNQAGVITMAGTLQTALAARRPTLPVGVVITTTGGSPAYGVLSSQYTDPTTQRTVLSLINVNQNQRNVTLTLQPGIGNNVTNLITGQPVGLTHSMAPHDILLLSFTTGGGGMTNPFWDAFVTLHSLSGVKTNNADSDRLSDWGEYVFDGNPNDSNDVGVLPTFDGPSGEYAFQLRNDTNILARVLTSTNLADPIWVTNETINVTVHDGTMGAHVSTLETTNSLLFLKLLVEDMEDPAPGVPAYQVIIGAGGTNGVASSGNGNFEAETSSGELSFANTAHWHDLEGNDVTTFFSHDVGFGGSPEPNSRGAYVFGHMAANDTGYTVVASGEKFDVSLALHKHGGGYTGDEVLNVVLFASTTGVTAATTLGDITILATTSFAVTGSWVSEAAAAFYTTTASDVGKTLYLGLDLDNPTGNNVYPRIDVVRLEVNK